MLQREYLSVLEVKTCEALLDESLRFCRGVGFEIVSAMAVVDQIRGEPRFFSVDNAPTGYVEQMGGQMSGKDDPVMQHCKHRAIPIIWDQDTYIRAGQAERWEIQARFGYRCGVAKPRVMGRKSLGSQLQFNSLLFMRRRRRCRFLRPSSVDMSTRE